MPLHFRCYGFGPPHWLLCAMFWRSCLSLLVSRCGITSSISLLHTGHNTSWAVTAASWGLGGSPCNCLPGKYWYIPWSCCLFCPWMSFLNLSCLGTDVVIIMIALVWTCLSVVDLLSWPSCSGCFCCGCLCCCHSLPWFQIRIEGWNCLADWSYFDQNVLSSWTELKSLLINLFEWIMIILSVRIY